MKDHECPISRDDSVQSTWKKDLSRYVNGCPIERTFQWSMLLTHDVVTVRAALKPLTGALTGARREEFLKKLASVIPNSHCRNILLQFYLSSVLAPSPPLIEGGAELLVVLVEFYPLAVHMVNMALRPHFSRVLAAGQGREECEVIIWCEPYFDHVFTARDSTLAAATVEFLSQFRFRAVHEFLLDTASRPPHPARPDYWLLLHRILTVISPPGNPPALVSYNKYSSVLFSVIASLPTGCPLHPSSFLQICPPDSEDTFYKNVSLTPGIVGLAAYTALKYPIPSLLPHIAALITVSHNATLSLCGCLLYPLTILGKVNPELAGVVEGHVARVLALPTGGDRDDSSDSYADSCVSTEATFFSLKLGQVLSGVAARKGAAQTQQVEEQFKEGATLTPITAALLTHCLVLNHDRPSSKLIKQLKMADDATNIPLLTFLLLHMRLIIEGRVRQSTKFISLYILSLPDLLSHASLTNLRRSLKLISRSSDIFLRPEFHEIYYNSLFAIWEQHGGASYEHLAPLLLSPGEGCGRAVSVAVRRMCGSERDVDLYDMHRVIVRFLTAPDDWKTEVLGNCIDALTLLSRVSYSFSANEHLIIPFLRDRDVPNISMPLCFWYSEYLASLDTADESNVAVVADCLEQLWDFSRHHDVETAGMAYKGLLNCGVEFDVDSSVMENVSALLQRYDYPQFSARFLAKMLERELERVPAAISGGGSGPNWAKRLLETAKGAEQTVVNTLFSFSRHTVNASREQYKKQLRKNEGLLNRLLERSARETEGAFSHVFDGLLLVEGWCHFMAEFLEAILATPTYQNNARNALSLLDRLVTAKKQVKDQVDRQLGKLNGEGISSDRINSLRVLTLTGTDYAFFRLGLKHELTSAEIRDNLGNGMLRNMLGLPLDSAGATTETACIMLLCLGRLSPVLEQVDVRGLELNLGTCAKKVLEDPGNRLLTDCAAVATGVCIHAFYKHHPKHSANKDAIQLLLDHNHYLGLSFCLDSFYNSMSMRAIDHIIEEFMVTTAGENSSNTTATQPPDYTFFHGLLLTFSVFVHPLHEPDMANFLGYLGAKIDEVRTVEEQEMLLLTQSLILYLLSHWQARDEEWRTVYTTVVEECTRQFTHHRYAKPVLAAFTGFPFSPLVNWFDWAPNLEFSDAMDTYLELSRGTSYPEGILTTLVTARTLQNHTPTTRLQFNSSGGALWSLVSELISDNSQKHQLRFLLDVLSHVTCRLPLSNPVPTMAAIYTRTSLKVDVIKFVAVHVKVTSPVYFHFISRFLTLSVFPLMSLEAQTELIKLLPNYVACIPARTLDSFFSTFLSEVFWQGNKELRLTVLSVMGSFLDTSQFSAGVASAVSVALVSKFFITSKFRDVLCPETVSRVGDMMRRVGFTDFPLLCTQTQLVEECVAAGYRTTDLVSAFFSSYLDKEFSADLQRSVVRILLRLPKDTAYGLLVGLIERATAKLAENPKDFINPGVACMNSVMFAYLVESNATKPLGHGLEHFTYLTNFLEPETNANCVRELLQHVEPWTRLIRLYDDFFE